MPTFSVTSQPQQLYPGWQDETSLINLGPSRVYLDDNPSVSPVNSFPLAPLDTMTWAAGRELWGVSELGSCQLGANPSGRLSIANAERQTIILREHSQFLNKVFDVSAYQTVQIICMAKRLDNTALFNTGQYAFDWYPDAATAQTNGAKNVSPPNSLEDRGTFWCSQNDNAPIIGTRGSAQWFTITMPVKGSWVNPRITLSTTGIDVDSIEWIVYGLTRSLPYSLVSPIRILPYMNGVYDPNGYGADAVGYNSYYVSNMTPLTNLTRGNRIYLPDGYAYADIGLNFSPAVTTSSDAGIISRAEGTDVQGFFRPESITSGGTTYHFYRNIILPQGLPSYIYTYGVGGTGVTYNATITLHN